MKKIIAPAAAILAILMATSCTTKFNIGATYKNITVVYGLLDMADTAHYIRIEKAFLDNTKNALTMAQVPDSSYYADLNVKIERVDAFNSGNIIDTIHLNMVDLDLEGYPKQPGAFFNAPNYAYKFKNTLNPQYTYRLIITNLLTGEKDSSEAPVIDDNPSALSVPLLDNVYTNLNGLDFHSTLPNADVRFSATYSNPVGNYNFNGYNSPVDIAEAIVTLNWGDTNLVTHAVTYRSYDYNAGYLYNLSIGSGIEFDISDRALYDAVATGIGPAPSGISRVMKPCTLSLYVSTPDYATYQNYVSSQSVGLNASQIEPVYTNIKGNALGLFTSRGTRTGTIDIQVETLDSLNQSTITQGVNFLIP